MSKKPIYLVLDIDIHNLENYQEYIQLGKPIVEKFGGEYLIRGGTIDNAEINLWKPQRMVIIKFPDQESASNWYNSDEYQSIKGIRTRNSTSTLIFVEGI